MNLEKTTFDGVAIGEDAANGVGFFQGFTDTPRKIYGYAGLFSGTNLGAPLMTEDGKTATWNGHFRSIGHLALETDFTLTIDFSTSRTLEATTRVGDAINSPHHFFLENNTYDTNGVITGRIIIQNDSDFVRGIVTGLIGTKGAVGAFISGTGTKNQISIFNNSIGAKSYAGGFVASPTAVKNPKITIDDWTGSFDGPLKRNVRRYEHNSGLPDSTGANKFFLRENPAERASWKKPDGGGSLSLSQLGGDATDGVDFFPAEITHYKDKKSRSSESYYAGLWDSTDLGAALEATFNAQSTGTWNGQFSAIQGDNPRFDTSFVLAIDFGANTFSTTIDDTDDNNDYYLSGDYDRASGLMTGTVRHDAGANASSSKNGILTGLIGQEGAVGVFVSNDGGTNKNTIAGGTDIISTYSDDGLTKTTPAVSMFDGYAGGFVARPN